MVLSSTAQEWNFCHIFFNIVYQELITAIKIANQNIEA